MVVRSAFFIAVFVDEVARDRAVSPMIESVRPEH
jgi:hypothetical protein